HFVPLATALHRYLSRSEDEEKTLARWFWLMSYKASRAGIPKLLQLLDAMSRPGAGHTTEAEVLIHDLPPLPPRYDFRSGRCKLMALRLAERAGPESLQILAQLGADALAHLVLDPNLDARFMQSPGNRIIVAPEAAAEERERIRTACINGDDEVRRRHAIPWFGRTALDAGEPESFIRERMHRLLRLDDDFLRRLGLRPEEPPSDSYGSDEDL
ncbi:MAG TPA: hypothetical protein VLS89_15165, partial [Candidatus Nanopelagicales bacterium]|nr:hypothetical protein [Candidatus Nanopelagicales bacterium]